MKRVIALIIALIITLSFAACGRIIDGSRDDDIPKTDKTDKNSRTEPSGDDTPVLEIDKAFVGLWHSMNVVGSGFAERYAFYEDGTFIYGANQMDDDPLIYASGTWGVSDGKLKLFIMEKLFRSNDEGDVDIKKIKPPEVASYSIKETGPDPETGRDTIAIGGVTYYNYDNQTDMFESYYELTN
ncbi:MAG TPA: hypothetical protein GX501_04190 [Clostridiaceae bacterium]|nr:hypothetical protein [Clostridiaceae bacterium]